MGITYQNTLDCDINMDYYPDNNASREDGKHEIVVGRGGRERCVLYGNNTGGGLLQLENRDDNLRVP